LSARKKFWNISATEDYILQEGSFGTAVQHNIQESVMELAYHKDPREVGLIDDCGTEEKDCGILVILPGLPFEITYALYPDEEKIWLIDCHPLDIFHNLQTE